MTWTNGLRVAFMAACIGLALVLLTGQADGHRLVPCSVKQTPQSQLRCGKLNRWHGITAARFLQKHPKAGTRKSRRALGRTARYLTSYGKLHITVATNRMRPPIDGCLMGLILREGSGFRPNDPSTWQRAAMKWNGGHVAPWTSTTTYGGSGAYGVPQALPGSKMASAGPDWATNPWTQIKWMIGYVWARYGGPCAALAFHNSAGSY